MRSVRLRGPVGLAALGRTLDVSTELARDFRMDLQIGVLEHVRVLHVVATPFTARWPASAPRDGLTAVVLPTEGAVTIQSANGVGSSACGGLVLPAHEPVVVRAERAVRFFVLCIDPLEFDSEHRADPAHTFPSTSLTATARSVLRAFLTDLDITHPIQAEYLQGTVLRLGKLLGSVHDESMAERLATQELIEMATRIIRSDAGDPALDPNRVALACGVSLRTLQRTIAEERGTTVREMIIAARTQNALRIVHSPGGTELPLSDIASRSGFSSLERLRRAIAAETGLSPGQYRRSRVAEREVR
ncbi:AraC family transcriptional regulator [Rathayibacter toxicus]|uniref:AraC family transcriptional regulator n=2 Tax=Rathayibacter toxicus TaxID=145458 RepID=A0A0C5BGF9_9MICO|nr:hypothetical protein TI83_10350 [Rathayibacter toxicus]ALS57495.1 hypothetical protein APU90_06715 [Rathayibacter toxicus]KKM46800.1 hypothetical protein VT73_01990 [Rathayibacter toxicus]PPG20834.1 AraC family transcriptional regulator [Rathayibacter toxicus]PPG45937.1 AraC family transcriptional regulator [Rathayibacter toxicus]